MALALVKHSLPPPHPNQARAPSTTFSSSSSSISIPSSLPFMADYLMGRLGYPKDQALAASKPLLRITSPEKPNAVIDFLRRCAGLSLPQLHRFVRCRPANLVADVSSNLLPKLALFRSLLSDEGASPDHPPPKEFAIRLRLRPRLRLQHRARLAPALDLLRSLFANDYRKVASVLRRFSRLLTNDPKKVLTRNIAILRRRHGEDPGYPRPQPRAAGRCIPYCGEGIGH